MNLFVIAGHHGDAPGARAYNGKYEHDYTTRLQKLIAKERHVCEFEGSLIKDQDDQSLNQVIRMINEQAGKRDYGLDIHFNPNLEGASGTEVFVHANTTRKNKRIATELAEVTSDLLEIPLRRGSGKRVYKYPWESHPGRLGIIDKTNIPMILWEVCFLTKQDMEKFFQNERELAWRVTSIYGRHFKRF